MNGVIEGKLVAVGESRDGVYQLDLAVEDENGDYTRPERVSGFEEAAREFAKLKGVNTGSKIRVAYKQKGKFKNIDLTAEKPLEVKINAVKPRSPDYRVFHSTSDKPRERGKQIEWLACLKGACALASGGMNAAQTAELADNLMKEYEARFKVKEE